MRTEDEIQEKLMQVNSELVNMTEAYRFTDNQDEADTYRYICDWLCAQRQVLNWLLKGKAWNPVIDARFDQNS